MSKSEMLNEYYFDELVALMDEYAEMQKPEDEQERLCYADELD